MSAESYVLEPLAVIEKLIPREWGARYRSAALSVAEVYRREAAGVPVHRIHGDCHLGNLLRGREGFFFLDFDDMLVGPAVQDLWLLMAGGEATDLAQRALFVEAYQQFRPFQHRWLRLIEPLRAMRWIHYSAWVARRWNDPAFPHAFPDFGTPKYWERETLDLERQIVNIREALA
jgi:Ser/Thr protein kinase RdoA (MazF antagonist)